MLDSPHPELSIYPDASSTYAMGVLLEQYRKIVSTFSRKLNKAQLKYMVTSQELLAAVEACKLFAQINYSCEIWIHKDHQHLAQNE